MTAMTDRAAALPSTVEWQQWAESRIVAVSCSEIRGPRSVFLANQVLDPRFLVKVVPRRGVRCLTKDLGPSAIIAITIC